MQKALLLMGKEKMNPPTEEIAVLMEAEPGEKGKYLLMAGIAVLGIGLLFVLPPLGVAVLFASMVGNGLMHGRESKKLESALKAFGCILRLQRTARELGKEKISGLEMYQKRLEEQEKQLRPITRKCRTLVNTKESQGGAANMIFAYFHTFFLLDLIEYSSVVSGVKSYEKAILQMAEDLGLLDFALSAASYRESLSYYCRPEFLDEKRRLSDRCGGALSSASDTSGGKQSVCGGRNSADRLECVGKIHIYEKHGSECDSGTGTEHESFEAVPRCCVPDHDIHGTPR